MTDSNNSPLYMPVAPAYGYGGNNGGGIFGNGGGDLWGFLLVLLLCGNGMWGGLGGGLGGMMWPLMMGGMGGGFGLDYLYPWLNNSEHISDGFRDQQIQSTLTGIQSGITTGFSGVQQSLCSGFAGVNATVNGAQNAIAQQLYGNEIANLNRSFAEQTANTAGFNGVQSALCDIRYGSATNTRDIIESQNKGTQLAQAQRENVGLQNQLNMAALRESQTAQNAFIQQGFSNEVDALYNRLSNCPVPSTPVYGRTPIFTCPGANNTGCGCGNNAFMN